MIKGSIVALVTPFNSDGSVNYSKIGELIDYHIANYTDGIVILGTTGETATLTFEEKERIVAYSVRKVNKRVPLIVGSGSNVTENAIKQSSTYSRLGADYLLVITPFYNKTNDEGLIKHFEKIAASSTCPVILYNVPSRTGMEIKENVIKVLSKNKNIVGIKDSSGSIEYAMKISKYLTDEFVLLSGNDDIIVPLMAIGAKGVISVLANIYPFSVHKMVSLCLDEQYKEAMKLQNKYQPIIKYLFIETNPIPIKTALNYLGFDVGKYRLPLFPMSEQNRILLCNEIKKLKESEGE